ncbi:hypothetical protein Pcinc_016669 [Petrolisthes cinctipes]|uniref:DUF4806 domain-containing protein n=1 Tax=Petrolisthes cinctipes TaxID=88211 RepID=A0AAE1KPI8_PETCI|nr:hypothetical protein Pcinc_016669 [Petrolisthes cinctipes]
MTSAGGSGPDLALLQGLLPLKTYKEFDDFEQKLNTDSDLKQSLVQRLQFLGGSTVKAAVKSMIDHCMTSGLQYEYNWEGRLGWNTKTNTTKRGFKNTRLCELLSR